MLWLWKLTLLSISSQTGSIGMRSGLHGGQSSKQILWPCIICCVVLAVWGVALSCTRTIPRFALMCRIAAGWRTKFWYLAAFRFWWIGTMGVFVCNDIPAHIITVPPPNCPLWSPQIEPGLIGKENLTPICKGIPQMTSCLSLTKLSVSGWQHKAYIWPSRTQSSIPLPVSNSLVTEGPSKRSESVPCCCACCKIPFPTVGYTNVAVLLRSRHVLACEVNRQHFRLR